MKIEFPVQDQNGKASLVVLKKIDSTTAYVTAGGRTVKVSRLRKNLAGTIIKGVYMLPVTLEVNCGASISTLRVSLLGTFRMNAADCQRLRQWINKYNMPIER